MPRANRFSEWPVVISVLPVTLLYAYFSPFQSLAHPLYSFHYQYTIFGPPFARPVLYPPHLLQYGLYVVQNKKTAPCTSSFEPAQEASIVSGQHGVVLNQREVVLNKRKMKNLR